MPIAAAAMCLVAAGCVGPSYVAEKPTTLEQVNGSLEGRAASILLLTGRRIGNLRYVHVKPDTTFYRSYYQPQTTRYLLTAQIAQIRYRTDSGARDGFIVGLLPGLALGAAGLIILAGSNDTDPSHTGVVGYSAMVGGAILALVGGVVGAVLGNDLGRHEIIVYEHPATSNESEP